MKGLSFTKEQIFKESLNPVLLEFIRDIKKRQEEFSKKYKKLYTEGGMDNVIKHLKNAK